MPDPLIAQQYLRTGGGEPFANERDLDLAMCGVEADHGGVGDSDAFGCIFGEGRDEGEVCSGKGDETRRRNVEGEGGDADEGKEGRR